MLAGSRLRMSLSVSAEVPKMARSQRITIGRISCSAAEGPQHVISVVQIRAGERDSKREATREAPKPKEWCYDSKRELTSSPRLSS